jgi:hypothetical protein
MKDETITNGVVFLRSYYESITSLEDGDKLEMYEAVFKHYFDGIEPTFSKAYLNGFWSLMKPNIDNSVNRYNNSVNNGKKGGRPKNGNTSKPPTEDKPEVVKTIDETLKVVNGEPSKVITPVVEVIPEVGSQEALEAELSSKPVRVLDKTKEPTFNPLDAIKPFYNGKSEEVLAYITGLDTYHNVNDKDGFIKIWEGLDKHKFKLKTGEPKISNVVYKLQGLI